MVGVGVSTTLVVAPALKSPTVQQYAECVSVGTRAFVLVVVCCSVEVPTPSDPRHTQIPIPVFPSVETLTVPELEEAATAVDSLDAQVPAVALLTGDVNVRPVAAAVPCVFAASHIEMTMITSPVCHATDAETIGFVAVP